MVQRYSLSSANGACLHDLILGIVVTLTDLDIPQTNSINVTAIAKDDVHNIPFRSISIAW